MNRPDIAQYPWLQTHVESLTASAKRNSLSHAILISGIEGVGKLKLAEALSFSLICHHVGDTGQSCGNCQPCRLLLTDNHPDLKIVEVEPKKSQISIGQIREINDFLQLRSQQGEAKVVVLKNAEKMSISAANSLLKTLEEPTSESFIFLLSSQIERLLPTIRSRCLQVHISTPSSEVSEAWLKQQGITDNVIASLSISGGAPLAAKVVAESDTIAQRDALFKDWCAVAKPGANILDIANRWQKQPVAQTSQWIASFIEDAIKIKMGSHSDVRNRDFLDKLQHVAQILDVKQLFLKLEQLGEMRRHQSIALNQQMFWQSWLM